MQTEQARSAHRQPQPQPEIIACRTGGSTALATPEPVNAMPWEKLRRVVNHCGTSDDAAMKASMLPKPAPTE